MPKNNYRLSCGDPVLEDSCCKVVSIRNDEDLGFVRGARYHAHLFENGKMLVVSPVSDQPYVAKSGDFLRVVEDHHDL